MSAQLNYQPSDDTFSTGERLLKPIRNVVQQELPVSEALRTTLTSRRVHEHMPLILTVARVEINRHPQYILDFGDLVSISAITLFKLLRKYPDREFNNHYLSNAMKWGIRNELRTHYRWYAIKKADKSDSTGDLETQGADTPKANSSLRYPETITSLLSFDDTTDNDNLQHDARLASHQTPEQLMEQTQEHSALRNALQSLPERERRLIEARFFRNLKMREIATIFDISPSRASRIISASLVRLRKELDRTGFQFDES